MAARKKDIVVEEQPQQYVTTVRLAEGGQIYPEGTVATFEDLEYDRLVFLLVREFLRPIEGYGVLTGELGEEVRRLRG